MVLPGPEGSDVVWLQSTESGDLAFLLMDPRAVEPKYKVELAAHELAELAVSDASELSVYTLLVVPQDPTKIRTNLKAPVLINTKLKLGKQVVMEKSDYPIQFFLAQARSQDPQEVDNARSNA